MIAAEVGLSTGDLLSHDTLVKSLALLFMFHSALGLR